MFEVQDVVGAPNSSAVDLLASTIKSKLSPWLYPHSDGFQSTLEQMVNQSWRIMVTFPKEDPMLWPTDAIHNSYADSPVLSTMEMFNDRMVKVLFRMLRVSSHGMIHRLGSRGAQASTARRCTRLVGR